MPTDDSGHDAASDLPWDDDAPLPPYPVIATDPDPGDTMPHPPGLPKSATWPDHEELLALRELRRDLDLLLSTEGQSHADVMGAVSGLVASVGQRAAHDIAPSPAIASILHRWGPGTLWEIATEDGDVDGYVRAVDHETAMRAASEMGCEGDYTASECAEEPDAARLDHAVADITLLLTEHARLTAENATLRDRLQVAEGSLEMIHERATIALAARRTP